MHNTNILNIAKYRLLRVKTGIRSTYKALVAEVKMNHKLISHRGIKWLREVIYNNGML